MNLPKRDFIGKQGPPGYVAGIGRGATGFTTRSDIGPAREAAAMAAAAAMASTSGSVGTPADAGPARKMLKRSEEDDEEQYLNESNYDEFAGYGGSLFNKDPYEDDDEEADKTYDSVDKRMDERGKKQREAKIRQDLEKYRQERPKIQQQFSDLKADLKRVSEAEWMSIPEVGDARNRKQRVARQDKFTPVPDSILAHQAKLASGGERLLYLDLKSSEEDPDGMDTEPAVGAGHENSLLAKAARGELALSSEATGGLNIGEMSEFRGSYMSMKLSRVAGSEGQLPATNAQDYLTNLEAMGPTKMIDEAAANEYRKQFAKLRADNPSFPNAWIVSVRLEEAAGKLKAARSLVLAACEKCPKSADIWCEAARLYPPEAARALMVKALKEIPHSVKLWCRAAELEPDELGRRKVYAKARELAPRSVLLWKKSAELEQPDEARLILRDAVECCPEAVELWLALARLEPYERAVQTLSRASEKNPTERSILITLAKLEEAAGHRGRVGEIVKRSLELLLKARKLDIKRDEWFKEAMDAEKANFRTTCHEIIKRTIALEDQQQQQQLDQQPASIVLMDRSSRRSAASADNDYDKQLKSRLADAQKFLASGAVECARAVYETLVEPASRFRASESVWLSYADFERKHAGPDQLEALLRRAVQPNHCASSESLWLMLAHERRAHLAETRQILSDALDAKPDSERIVLAAVELECDNHNHKVARRILADACMRAKTAQLVMKAAKLEWELGNLDEAQRMLSSNLDQYKAEAEFYLSMGQIEEQRQQVELAKSHYAQGLKFCPTSVELWIAAAKLEEKTGSLARARSKYQNAILRNPKVPRLYLESAQLELRAHESQKGRPSGSRPTMVTTLLAKGVRECANHPELGLLLAEQSKWSGRRLAGI